jgi:competence protein ComEC
MKFNLRLITAIAFLLVFSVKSYGQNSPNTMSAHFINVGQADATLLEFSCGAILIDAGAQDTVFADKLIQYLNAFFTRRKDLNNTLSLVLITHNHIDHDYALDLVAKNFHITNFIDNGVPGGSGEPNQGGMEKTAAKAGIPYASYSYEQAIADGKHDGITNKIIDPISCSVVNPQISILSGRFQTKPTGWTAEDYSDQNNQSLVIKVTFGKASFLFTGDLQLEALQQLLNYYGSSTALDVDVLRVGHHGSINATTAAYLKAVSPLYAIISCGQWNFGIGPPVETFSTYAYGHPSSTVISLLSSSIPGNRPVALTVHEGTGSKKFITGKVVKNIYATAWDGTITISATDKGVYTLSKTN